MRENDQLSLLAAGGASCTGACARDFCGAAFFAAVGAGCGFITAAGALRAGGEAPGSAGRCAACAPCGAVSGVMMLIGGIEAALGKSPDTGLPGDGTVPSAATGAGAPAPADGAFQDGA